MRIVVIFICMTMVNQLVAYGYGVFAVKNIHASYIIPKWWKNCPNINLEDLQAEPNCLENNKDIIDEWVNNLLKKRE